MVYYSLAPSVKHLLMQQRDTRKSYLGLLIDFIHSCMFYHVIQRYHCSFLNLPLTIAEGTQPPHDWKLRSIGHNLVLFVPPYGTDHQVVLQRVARVGKLLTSEFLSHSAVLSSLWIYLWQTTATLQPDMSLNMIVQINGTWCGFSVLHTAYGGQSPRWVEWVIQLCFSLWIPLWQTAFSLQPNMSSVQS